jgi:NitT/TauT family transport system substrate-binding protein
MTLSRLSRFTKVAAIGLATVLIASACGSSSSTAVKSGTALPTVTVGQLPIADTVSIAIAQKEGYFKQQGINVKTVPIVQSTQAIPMMLHGTVDITSGNYVNFIAADLSGAAKIKVVAAGSSCTGVNLDVLALPKSKITGPGGLVGKTIAVNINPDIQTLTINALLKANNVNPASVHYVVIPFADMLAALKAGRVNSIAETEPYTTLAQETLGAVSVLPECAGPTAAMPIGGFFATDQWLAKNQKTALAFQRAFEKAQGVADTNRKLVEQLLPTYTKITPKVAALITLPNYPTTLDQTQIQRVAALMFAGGMLKSSFNVSPILFHAAG